MDDAACDLLDGKRRPQSRRRDRPTTMDLVNHHGTPFSIGMICVSRADQRLRATSDLRQGRPLHCDTDDVVNTKA